MEVCLKKNRIKLSLVYIKMVAVVFLLVGGGFSCKPVDSKFSSVDNSSFDESGARSSFSLGIKIDGSTDGFMAVDQEEGFIGEEEEFLENPRVKEDNKLNERVYIKEVLKENPDSQQTYPLSEIQLIFEDQKQKDSLSLELQSEFLDLHLKKEDTIEALLAYAEDTDESSLVYEFWVKNIQSWGVAMDYILANESVSSIVLKIDRKGIKLKTPNIDIPKLKKEDMVVGNYEGRCLVYSEENGKKYPISCSLVELDLYCRLSKAEKGKKVRFESRRACVINKHKIK